NEAVLCGLCRLRTAQPGHPVPQTLFRGCGKRPETLSEPFQVTTRQTQTQRRDSPALAHTHSSSQRQVSNTQRLQPGAPDQRDRLSLEQHRAQLARHPLIEQHQQARLSSPRKALYGLLKARHGRMASMSTPALSKASARANARTRSTSAGPNPNVCSKMNANGTPISRSFAAASAA